MKTSHKDQVMGKYDRNIISYESYVMCYAMFFVMFSYGSSARFVLAFIRGHSIVPTHKLIHNSNKREK